MLLGGPRDGDTIERESAPAVLHISRGGKPTPGLDPSEGQPLWVKDLPCSYRYRRRYGQPSSAVIAYDYEEPKDV